MSSVGGTKSKKFGRRMSGTPSYWETSSLAEAETHCSDPDDKSHASHSRSVYHSDSHSFGGGKGWENWGSTDSHSYMSNNEPNLCDVDPFDSSSSEELTGDLVSVCSNVEDAMSTATKGRDERSVVSYDPSQMSYSRSMYPGSQGDTESNAGPYSESACYEKVIRPNLNIKSTNLLSSGVSKFKGSKRRDSFLGRKSFMKEMDKDEKAINSRRSSLAAMLRLDNNISTSRKSSLASSILSIGDSSRSVSHQTSKIEPFTAGDDNDVDLKKDYKGKKLSPIAYRFLMLGLLLIILGVLCIILLAVFFPETMAGSSVRNASSSLLRNPNDDVTKN